jgi:hypothetical protein
MDREKEKHAINNSIDDADKKIDTRFDTVARTERLQYVSAIVYPEIIEIIPVELYVIYWTFFFRFFFFLKTAAKQQVR